MHSLVFSVIAAGFAALVNWSFRANTLKDKELDNSNGYLLSYYLTSFPLSLIISPEIWTIPLDLTMLITGCCVGFINIVLMLFTSKALKRGPAALTFAFQSSSSIIPGLILFSIFGSKFGYTCTPTHVLGITLVIFGLFLGTRTETTDQNPISKSWLKYAIGCFIAQAIALTLIQGRCIFFEMDKLGGFLSQFALSKSADVWFMPGQYGMSLLMISLIYFRGNGGIKKHEVLYGNLGGLATTIATCFLLFATKNAMPFEKGILFPCYAVATIILCNVWANRLYKENFNFLANSVCAVGIFLSLI